MGLIKVIFYNSVLIICLIIINLATPKLALAEKLIFADTFDQELMQWQPTRDNGQYWSIVDNQLQGLINQRQKVSELVPIDSIWKSGWQNILVKFEMTPKAGVDRNFIYNYKDLQNFYNVHFVGNQMFVDKIKNGQVVFSTSSSVSLSNNTTYSLVVIFQNGTTSISINNQVISTFHDPTFESVDYGKFGLSIGTGAVFPSQVLFDNIEIFDLDQPSSTVPIMKQHDASWGELTYDHATTWSTKPTITTWGCALTSLAMIMNGHGINKMSNGEALTPASLNQWLISQPDGYVGGGLVNFLAAMRLTKQLSQIYQTPALEYTRINYDSESGLTPAINEIQEDRPVIVQLPGHFVVADAVTNNNELAIKDPAFVYDRLSQHSSLPLSFRTFYPSFTDLSYLLIISNPSTDLTIQSPSGNDVTSSVIESIVAYSEVPDLPESEIIAPSNLHNLAKPELGSYIIKVLANELDSSPIPVYYYNKNGDVAMDNIVISNSRHPQLFKVQINNDGSILVDRTTSLENWSIILDHEYQQNSSLSPTSWIWLKYYAQHGLNSEQDPSPYFILLKKVLQWYRNEIEISTYDLLMEELNLAD